MYRFTTQTLEGYYFPGLSSGLLVMTLTSIFNRLLDENLLSFSSSHFCSLVFDSISFISFHFSFSFSKF